MSDESMKRRDFLRKSSQFAIGAGAMLAGCGSPDDPESRGKMLADMGRPQDMRSPQDMGIDDVQPDLGQSDLDDAQDMPPGQVIPFTKPPFIQLLGLQTARLRFETREETPQAVRLERRGQAGTELLATSNWQDLSSFEWPIPIFAKTVDHPDKPGWHNMQEVRFDNLEQGAVYDWIVHQGNGVETRGSFEVGRPFGESFDLGWISDTMSPHSTACFQTLASLNPTMSLHGGDLQYMSNPLDSWSGFFHSIAPLTSLGALHTCVGNHELEGLNEFELQYRRSFEGHGFTGSNIDYSYVDFAGVRMLLLNSESDLFDESSAQRSWLISQLEEVQSSPMLRYAIVAFHRPFFTLSKSKPSFAARDRLHPLFRDFDVPLVFTGHNHCYERFEVEGVTYVMDGGGGALSSGTDHSREEVLAERPEDEARRKFAESSYGVTLARINADGTLNMNRYKAADGTAIDTYSIG
jgi:hypothetical protein